MKTLVGVDIEGTYLAAVDLCRRFEFPDQHWVLSHVIQQIPMFAPALAPMAIPVTEAMVALREEACHSVEKARKHLGLDVGACTELVPEGTVAATLLHEAGEYACDLIVAGSGHAKKTFPWTVGSVSRALAFASKQSLLATKQPSTKTGPLHAVFATDHSDYANAAIEQLIKWKPKGIDRIDVVTAFDVNEATLALMKVGTEVKLDFEKWVREETERRCHLTAGKLSNIAKQTRVIVEKGEVNEVIRSAMIGSGADVLILGAQGHGFVERLFVGSTSLHHVLAEPYPVLLIRPPVA
jgi:nucleotide-binding universal stress UspA family protein